MELPNTQASHFPKTEELPTLQISKVGDTQIQENRCTRGTVFKIGLIAIGVLLIGAGISVYFTGPQIAPQIFTISRNQILATAAFGASGIILLALGIYLLKKRENSSTEETTSSISVNAKKERLRPPAKPFDFRASLNELCEIYDKVKTLKSRESNLTSQKTLNDLQTNNLKGIQSDLKQASKNLEEKKEEFKKGIADFCMSEFGKVENNDLAILPILLSFCEALEERIDVEVLEKKILSFQDMINGENQEDLAFLIGEILLHRDEISKETILKNIQRGIEALCQRAKQKACEKTLKELKFPSNNNTQEIENYVLTSLNAFSLVSKKPFRSLVDWLKEKKLPWKESTFDEVIFMIQQNQSFVSTNDLENPDATIAVIDFICRFLPEKLQKPIWKEIEVLKDEKWEKELVYNYEQQKQSLDPRITINNLFKKIEVLEKLDDVSQILMNIWDYYSLLLERQNLITWNQEVRNQLHYILNKYKSGFEENDYNQLKAASVKIFSFYKKKYKDNELGKVIIQSIFCLHNQTQYPIRFEEHIKYLDFVSDKGAADKFAECYVKALKDTGTQFWDVRAFLAEVTQKVLLSIPTSVPAFLK